MDAPPNRIIIVGGGIAGLVAAIELERRGRSVLLLEREAELGGRVRTRLVDGFRIDRGFQVLFTAYPMLASYLDLAALDLRPFQAAARIALPTGTSVVGDALRHPALLPETILSSHIPVGDIWRLLRLRQLARRLSDDACFAPRYARLTTRQFLIERGFTLPTIERFFAPFYGGILLDRSLESSAAVMLFTFRMLALGDTAVPARGMGAIAAQLGGALHTTEVRTACPVSAVRVADGRAVGVVLADGTVEDGTDVVLCTEAPAAIALAATIGLQLAALPTRALGCTTVYFASDRSLLPGRALTLNATEHSVISHAITVSDVAPEYAPAGQHLLAMTAVGEPAQLTNPMLERAALSELAMMRRSSISTPPRVVAIERVPYSQFAHPAGYAERRPSVYAGVDRLWFGGEALHSSSLDGAARAGIMVALEIINKTV